MKDRLNELQRKGVFIHLEPEHYEKGSNVCFSIEFRRCNEEKGYYTDQTGWYNDNHEFGDFGDVVESALKLAEWFLEDETRIDLIDSGYHNPDYRKYTVERGKFIQTLMK